MGWMGKVARHADLVSEMAQTVGADIGGAMEEGRLDPARYRSAVMRCTTCEAAEECPGWMASHPGAAAAPGYCKNRDLMAALRVAE